MQTTHSRHQYYKRTEQNDLTLLTDRDRPITIDLRHLSLTTNNITAKLTNQFIQTGLSTFDWQQLFTWLWWWLPGCRNVSHHHRQQSFSGLHSPGRSNYTITCYPRVQTIYCKKRLSLPKRQGLLTFQALKSRMTGLVYYWLDWFIIKSHRSKILNCVIIY